MVWRSNAPFWLTFERKSPFPPLRIFGGCPTFSDSFGPRLFRVAVARYIKDDVYSMEYIITELKKTRNDIKDLDYSTIEKLI
jgi:hypothetical protein